MRAMLTREIKMAELINLINSNVIEWRIATQCGILFVVLIGLLALVPPFKQSHVNSVPNSDQSISETPLQEKRARLMADKKTLKERIEQKQAQLREFERRLHQFEHTARESEDKLTDLYRKISDLKGGIESDKSKLRLRGDSTLTGR
jgi:peptidoglycan hydrolase CwlO-like protein